MDDFYLTLPSSVKNPQFENTSSRYVTRLPQVLQLERDRYVVAATDIIYPYSFVNVGRPLKYWIHFKNADPVQVEFPSAQYSDVEQIVDTLNFENTVRRPKRSAPSDFDLDFVRAKRDAQTASNVNDPNAFLKKFKNVQQQQEDLTKARRAGAQDQVNKTKKIVKQAEAAKEQRNEQAGDFVKKFKNLSEQAIQQGEKNKNPNDEKDTGNPQQEEKEDERQVQAEERAREEQLRREEEKRQEDEQAVEEARLEAVRKQQEEQVRITNEYRRRAEAETRAREEQLRREEKKRQEDEQAVEEARLEAVRKQQEEQVRITNEYRQRVEAERRAREEQLRREEERRREEEQSAEEARLEAVRKAEEEKEQEESNANEARRKEDHSTFSNLKNIHQQQVDRFKQIQQEREEHGQAFLSKFKQLQEDQKNYANYAEEYDVIINAIDNRPSDRNEYSEMKQKLEKIRPKMRVKMVDNVNNIVHFSERDGRIHMDLLDSDIIFIEFEEACAYFLGFHDTIVRQSGIAPSKVDFFGNVSTIYLYCDIVDPIIVGDQKNQLLSVIPCKGKYGEMIHHTIPYPRYLPIMNNTVDSIKVEFLSEFAEPINFNWGSTIIVLHFKKIQ